MHTQKQVQTFILRLMFRAQETQENARPKKDMQTRTRFVNLRRFSSSGKVGGQIRGPADNHIAELQSKEFVQAITEWTSSNVADPSAPHQVHTPVQARESITT
jgi:hypothetical protein